MSDVVSFNPSLLCQVCAGSNLFEVKVCWLICQGPGQVASTAVVNVRCCQFQSICH